MILNEILKLMKCFPGSSINSDGYLLLNKQHSGFSITDIEAKKILNVNCLNMCQGTLAKQWFISST